MLTAHVIPDELGGFAILQVMQWSEDGLIDDDGKHRFVRSFIRPIVMRWK